jgi:hypothetical protein
MKKEISVSDIMLDKNNANKHTEYGMKLLEKSLQQLGAGRSILLDKDNNVICGNAVTETAVQIGLNKLKIVETTGNEIIAVKRMDLSITDKKAKELAIADNAIANKNLDWDVDILNTSYDEVVLEDWGVDLGIADTDNDNDKSKSLNNVYEIVVEASNENEQEKIYNELNEQGYKCRLLTL